MLKTGEEVGGSSAGDEVAVGILPRRQRNDTRLQTGTVQTLGKQARSLLTGLVWILIEGDVDTTAGLIAKLRQLHRGQMSADGAGGVAKPSLSERSQVKRAFDQDHGRERAHRLPGKQASLGARQQSVGESCADTAAIEVHYTAVLAAREDHAPAKAARPWLLIRTPIEGICIYPILDR